MQDRGGFLSSHNTHFTGTGPKEAPTRHTERVSKQLSEAPGAGLTPGRDRRLAGSGGRSLGFAFSGGNHDKSVSAHSRLRTEGWSSAPPATSDLLCGPDKSLHCPSFHFVHVWFAPPMLHVLWGKNCLTQRRPPPPPVCNDNPSATVISSVSGRANKEIFPETNSGYQLALFPSSLH